MASLTLNIAEKGKAAFLLKPTSHVKRRRADFEEVKEEDKMLQTDKYVFLKGVKKLRQ